MNVLTSRNVQHDCNWVRTGSRSGSKTAYQLAVGNIIHWWWVH